MPLVKDEMDGPKDAACVRFGQATVFLEEDSRGDENEAQREAPRPPPANEHDAKLVATLFAAPGEVHAFTRRRQATLSAHGDRSRAAAGSNFTYLTRATKT